ncbi:unnamed protein product [Amoebophrya sp. A120]|nr:unnamed protein product [Amoebophrya sp. A120]|eukprot:GSA120T00004821001.1
MRFPPGLGLEQTEELMRALPAQQVSSPQVDQSRRQERDDLHAAPRNKVGENYEKNPPEEIIKMNHLDHIESSSAGKTTSTGYPSPEVDMLAVESVPPESDHQWSALFHPANTSSSPAPRKQSPVLEEGAGTKGVGSAAVVPGISESSSSQQETITENGMHVPGSTLAPHGEPVSDDFACYPILSCSSVADGSAKNSSSCAVSSCSTFTFAGRMSHQDQDHDPAEELLLGPLPRTESANTSTSGSVQLESLQRTISIRTTNMLARTFSNKSTSTFPPGEGIMQHQLTENGCSLAAELMAGTTQHHGGDGASCWAPSTSSMVEELLFRLARPSKMSRISTVAEQMAAPTGGGAASHEGTGTGTNALYNHTGSVPVLPNTSVSTSSNQVVSCQGGVAAILPAGAVQQPTTSTTTASIIPTAAAATSTSSVKNVSPSVPHHMALLPPSARSVTGSTTGGTGVTDTHSFWSGARGSSSRSSSFAGGLLARGGGPYNVRMAEKLPSIEGTSAAAGAQHVAAAGPGPASSTGGITASLLADQTATTATAGRHQPLVHPDPHDSLRLQAAAPMQWQHCSQPNAQDDQHFVYSVQQGTSACVSASTMQQSCTTKTNMGAAPSVLAPQYLNSTPPLYKTLSTGTEQDWTQLKLPTAREEDSEDKNMNNEQHGSDMTVGVIGVVPEQLHHLRKEQLSKTPSVHQARPEGELLVVHDPARRAAVQVSCTSTTVGASIEEQPQSVVQLNQLSSIGPGHTSSSGHQQLQHPHPVFNISNHDVLVPNQQQHENIVRSNHIQHLPASASSTPYATNFPSHSKYNNECAEGNANAQLQKRPTTNTNFYASNNDAFFNCSAAQASTKQPSVSPVQAYQDNWAWPDPAAIASATYAAQLPSQMLGAQSHTGIIPNPQHQICSFNFAGASGNAYSNPMTNWSAGKNGGPYNQQAPPSAPQNPQMSMDKHYPSNGPASVGYLHSTANHGSSCTGPHAVPLQAPVLQESASKLQDKNKNSTSSKASASSKGKKSGCSWPATAYNGGAPSMSCGTPSTSTTTPVLHLLPPYPDFNHGKAATSPATRPDPRAGRGKGKVQSKDAKSSSEDPHQQLYNHSPGNANQSHEHPFAYKHAPGGNGYSNISKSGTYMNSAHSSTSSKRPYAAEGKNQTVANARLAEIMDLESGRNGTQDDAEKMISNAELQRTLSSGNVMPRLRLRGLPFTAAEADILRWLQVHCVNSSRIVCIDLMKRPDGKPSGQARIYLHGGTPQDAIEMQSKLQFKYMGNRYLEVFVENPPNHKRNYS